VGGTCRRSFGETSTAATAADAGPSRSRRRRVTVTVDGGDGRTPAVRPALSARSALRREPRRTETYNGRTDDERIAASSVERCRQGVKAATPAVRPLTVTYRSGAVTSAATAVDLRRP